MNTCAFLTKCYNEDAAMLKVVAYLEQCSNEKITYDLRGTENLSDVMDVYLDYLDHRLYYDQIDNIKSDIVSAFTSDDDDQAMTLCEVFAVLAKQQFDYHNTITFNIECDNYSFPEDGKGWWVSWVNFE